MEELWQVVFSGLGIRCAGGPAARLGELDECEKIKLDLSICFLGDFFLNYFQERWHQFGVKLYPGAGCEFLNGVRNAQGFLGRRETIASYVSAMRMILAMRGFHSL